MTILVGRKGGVGKDHQEDTATHRPNFINETTEALRGSVTFPRSHRLGI